MTSDDIIAALVARHDKDIWASELAFDGGARRCDFWSLSAHASKGFLAIAYEIKVSRSDFQRDTAIKQRPARLFSDQFYYVTPPQMIAKNEVPDWAGLIELHGDRLKIVVQAPRRDKDLPTWQLVASLIRNSGEVRRDSDLIREQRNYYRRMVKEAETALRNDGLEPWRYGINT